MSYIFVILDYLFNWCKFECNLATQNESSIILYPDINTMLHFKQYSEKVFANYTLRMNSRRMCTLLAQQDLVSCIWKVTCPYLQVYDFLTLVCFKFIYPTFSTYSMMTIIQSNNVIYCFLIYKFEARDFFFLIANL